MLVVDATHFQLVCLTSSQLPSLSKFILGTHYFIANCFYSNLAIIYVSRLFCLLSNQDEDMGMVRVNKLLFHMYFLKKRFSVCRLLLNFISVDVCFLSLLFYQSMFVVMIISDMKLKCLYMPQILWNLSENSCAGFLSTCYFFWEICFPIFAFESFPALLLIFENSLSTHCKLILNHKSHVGYFSKGWIISLLSHVHSPLCFR